MGIRHRTVRRSTAASRWSSEIVFGLEDPVGDALVLGRPLSAATERAEGRIEGPALILGACTYASPGLAASLEEASAGQPLVRLARDESGPARFADPLRRLPRREGRIVFDAWWLAEGQCIEFDDDTVFDAAPLVEDVITSRDFSLDADPEVVDGGTLNLSFVSPLCAPVGHWVELIRTNILAAVAAKMETPPGERALRMLTAPLRAKSFDANRLLTAMSTIGPGCDIHPTAWVERSVLGANVEVGPFAVVRNCVVGDNARIDAQAIAELSVVGEHARLQRRCLANMSLVYPHARVGGILQLGLAGEGSALKMFGVGTDMRLDGPVRVQSPDGLVDVDIAYQGVCIGHGAFVGSGVWIAPGRVIEAGRRVGRARDLFVL